MDVFIYAVLKPLLLLAVWAALVIPIALILNRVIPDGKVKRFLFKRRGTRY